MRKSRGVAIEAFGHTWQFTDQALMVLKPLGVGTEATLVTLIINITPIRGFRDGTFQTRYFGIPLLVQVNGSCIRVDSA